MEMEMEAVHSRVRSRSASDLHLDPYAPPYKRARPSAFDSDSEVYEENPMQNEDEAEASWMERLVDQVSERTWHLPETQSVASNERYLNDQLHDAALFHKSSNDGNGELQLELTSVVDAVPEAEAHVRSALDVVSWLLTLREEEKTQQSEVQDTLQRLQRQLERRQEQARQLEQQLDALAQDKAYEANVFQAKEQSLVTERRQLQQDKKQLEVQCAKLVGQEAAFKAQLRRKESEYQRLQKTLQDALQRSAKESRALVMGKVLNDKKDRTQPTGKKTEGNPDTALARQQVSSLEARQAELLHENSALSNNLETLQRRVESVAAQYKKGAQLFIAQQLSQGVRRDEIELARVPLDDFTPTPLAIGRQGDLQKYVGESLDKLQDRVDTFEHSMVAELESRERKHGEQAIAILKQKLEEAHAIINEQDRLLQASVSSSWPIRASRHPTSLDKENVDGSTGHLIAHLGKPRRVVDTVRLDELADDMEWELQALRHKEANVDEERRLLQDRGRKLDEDRLAFESLGWRHFLKPDVNLDDEDIDMQDTPASPATAAILQDLGIHTSMLDEDEL